MGFISDLKPCEFYLQKQPASLGSKHSRHVFMRSSNLNEVNDPAHSKSPVLVRHCSWAATKRLWKLCDQLFCSIAINIRAVLALFTRPGGRTLRYRSPACCDAAGCPGASTGRWRMHKKRRVSPILTPLQKSRRSKSTRTVFIFATFC